MKRSSSCFPSLNFENRRRGYQIKRQCWGKKLRVSTRKCRRFAIIRENNQHFEMAMNGEKIDKTKDISSKSKIV